MNKIKPSQARGLFYVACDKNRACRRAIDKIPQKEFTNRKDCDIIIVPNNLNIHSYRFFSRYGITIAFFAIQLSKLVLVKTLLLLDCIENLCYEEIVWRQLELAFFGAVTSVAALFIYS